MSQNFVLNKIWRYHVSQYNSYKTKNIFLTAAGTERAPFQLNNNYKILETFHRNNK